MKFGKEFISQMVPEWQEAYMDYNHLKSLLKDIQRFKLRTNPPANTAAGPHLKRKMTLYRAFSGLTQRYHNLKSPTSRGGGGGDVEDQVILVKSVQEEGSEGHYETNFLMSSEEGGEYELVYFRRLDEELNKVNKFYRSKVEEVRKEAAMLNKQMDALIAFRIKVENPTLVFDQSAEMSRLASDVATSAAAVMASTPSGARRTAGHMEAIKEIELSNRGISEEGCSQETDMDGTNTTHHSVGRETQPNSIKVARPAPLEVLNRVKINNTLETPRSTLRGVLKASKGTELNFRKKDLKKVEEQLKRAFVEFYQKLRLLKSYSFLNILAFSKIMKKYDKITARNASKAYLKMVDNSFLGNSDEPTRLMERVEATFIKHFTNSNRSKGINILKPKAKAERHRITFLIGLFTGCTIALIVALVVIIHLKKLITLQGSAVYMDSMFPLYSLFGYIVLHMLVFGADIYFWRRYRVNYGFIFGFKQGTELGFREVFLLGSSLAVLALATVISNLDMEVDRKTKTFGPSELLPVGLLILLLVILFCPFNIIYRSNRFFLLQCAFHCLCVPLYKVTLSDFFLADQLTSQVQAIRSLELYICYYGWGNYEKRKHKCNVSGVYNTFYFIVAVIPYWCRFLQCARRFYEEKDRMQAYNALKYLSTIVAVIMRTAYNLQKVEIWKILAITTSAISTVGSTYWDIIIDWGLLQRHSNNPWLRDKLLVSHQSVYFGAMILNVVLRFAWLQTVVPLKPRKLHKQALVTIFASLEIIRRGIWNFFRLENEHLNNVGKYRAFKSVPLPFSYDEDDDKDE
ncbi:PREDICTED: phosphate transporter PHO1 homolog 3-like isoform X2 [Nelumbo nucifera]|uniref:Phosphate transporter PHO1 homolog 3-like n=2 Tax=Nelumbo nucifera TaxID=4432 RepID=A0A822YK93_NELNU|nr:PREDICTED: phosphate transporter PHO1 homolog 3-like isoform X2 [Nelumbo nucifera]DAD31326.1 TPA_asm: hypothetical protein HUJ06_010177 [Nelumbo nucifera]